MIEKLSELEPGHNWSDPVVQNLIREYLREYFATGMFETYTKALIERTEALLADKNPFLRKWNLGIAEAAMKSVQVELPIVAVEEFTSGGYERDGIWRSNYSVRLAKVNPNTGMGIYGSYVDVANYVKDIDGQNDRQKPNTTIFAVQEIELARTQIHELDELGLKVRLPEAEFTELFHASMS